MLITTRSFSTTQRLHSLKFTLVNKSRSQHSVVAVRCEGRRFVRMRTRSLVPRSNTTPISLGTTLVHKGNELASFPGSSAPERDIEVVHAERAWYLFSREHRQR